MRRAPEATSTLNHASLYEGQGAKSYWSPDARSEVRHSQPQKASNEFIRPSQRRPILSRLRDQCLNEVLLRLGIAESAGFHDRANVVIGKRHDDLRGPVAVVLFMFANAGFGYSGFQASGSKCVRFDSSD